MAEPHPPGVGVFRVCGGKEQRNNAQESWAELTAREKGFGDGGSRQLPEQESFHRQV